MMVRKHALHYQGQITPVEHVVCGNQTAEVKGKILTVIGHSEGGTGNGPGGQTDNLQLHSMWPADNQTSQCAASR